MNEKEKEKELTRTLIKAVDESKDVWFNMGFQKGKLEEKKEELDFLQALDLDIRHPELTKRIKQLSKEIGGMK